MGLHKGPASRVKAHFGAPKTYVVFFAEALVHAHVHLIPRMSDLPEDRLGTGIFAYLGVEASQQIAPREADAIAPSLRDLIPTQELSRP